MGLGLRGVRGRGAAEAVGVTEAPLVGGPKSRVKRNQHIQLSLDLLHTHVTKDTPDVMTCVTLRLDTLLLQQRGMNNKTYRSSLLHCQTHVLFGKSIIWEYEKAIKENY